MKKKLSLIYILLFCFAYFVSSQNLVPNQSFEDAWSCPNSFATLSVDRPYPQWINPNKGTPDHLHVCSTFDAGVPENFAGNMYPNEGVAYAGIILREVFNDSLMIRKGISREYIQSKLVEPLHTDKLYCVKLFYANASKSAYSVDALGITLSTDKIGIKDAGIIIQMPQVMNRPGHIMDNVDYWQEMCGVYRAKGNEKYLTIGNFWDNSKTNFKRNESVETDPNFIYAYYFIDDVRVFEIDNTFECGCLNDLSFGTDYLADNYDPETGYNTLVIDELAIDGSNGRNDNNDGNDGNNGDDGSNGENGNGNNSGSNNGNDSTLNGNGGLNNLILGGKESEISNTAFENAKVGDKFKLNRIFFEFNSSELLTASFSELDRLLTIMLEKPNLQIEIRGHTDNIGNDRYNKNLSIKRAGAVYDYLIEKGIPKTQMKYRGFGNEVPIAENDTEEGRSMNRRVEIIIVEL